ncbi:MAG: trypsin-like serine protease, partial [Nannocystaceae bacterium]
MLDLRVSSFFAVTLLAPNLAWADGADDDAREVETAAPEDAPEIYGGTPTPICAWPTTVSLGGCTGTLVHPRVVVYAAHCGGNQNAVAFGENQGAPALTVGTEFCQTNPAYNGGASGRDQAFCVLSQSVGLPIVPPLMGCETGVLQGGQEVTIVGFGQADAVPNYGLKRNVTTTINSIQNDEAYIGGNGQDSCQGDSGGPVYVRLSSDIGGDDTWRVFGITSYGGQCGGGGYYSMMHTQMSWFEGASGIDLTPCF